MKDWCGQMTVRGRLPKPDELDPKASAKWSEWERSLAPFILSDALGTDAAATLPPLGHCGWSNIYPLAIFLLNKPRRSEPITVWDEHPFAVGRPTLAAEFRAQSLGRVVGFLDFLERWGFDEPLGLASPSQLAGAQAIELAINPVESDLSALYSDRKLIGLHTFTNTSQVARYVFRWRENDAVREIDENYHRLIQNRSIDLICAELLANCFEHGLADAGTDDRPRPECFVVAKLFSQRSAEKALELDDSLHHLATFEREAYKRASIGRYPLLKLVIADGGQGFAGNTALVTLFEEVHARLPSSEAELMLYALRPEVSSRHLDRIGAEWREHFEDPTEVVPSVHGLSEVAAVVREARGHWRLHSNNAVIDISYLEPPTGRRIAVEHLPEVYCDAMAVAGVIHYLTIPLDLDYRETPRVRRQHNSVSMTVMDAMEFVGSEGDASPEQIRAGIMRLREALVHGDERGAPIGPVLLNLTALDVFEMGQDTEDFVIACLADGLNRRRHQAPVLINGASRQIRSKLSRIKVFQKNFYLTSRVLPFVEPNDAGRGEFVIRVECSHELFDIREQLETVLAPAALDATVRSSESPDTWPLFQRVYEQNEGLFTISPIGTEFEFTGALKLNLADALSQRFLLGGRSFAETGARLRRRGGVLPIKRGPYYKYGEPLDTYLNFNALVGDATFLQDLVRWMVVAIQSMPDVDARTLGKGLVLAGFMHPGVRIVQELARHPSLRRAEVFGVERISDIRWDSHELRYLAGRRVVVVMDVVRSSRTWNAVRESLEYIGARPLGMLAIFSYTETADVPDMFTYSEASLSAVRDLAGHNVQA